MADKIRPLAPSVQKQIYYYTNEIHNIDPDIISETLEWSMRFENKNHVPLFYFTFTDPLGFRIKEHSDDNTYDFIMEDSPRNKKVILDHIRTLIFESYMNREGLIAKMNSSMRSYLLRLMDKNKINHYDDENLSFTAYLKDIEIFKITADEAGKFLITLPQNVLRTNPEEIPQSYEFSADFYQEISEHVLASSYFYRDYDHNKVLKELDKIRKFLAVTYGADTLSELNNNVSVIFSSNYRKIVEINAKTNGKLYVSYDISKDFFDKEYNKATLNSLYGLMDDELYKEGKKMIDSFSDEEVVLLSVLTGALQDYNSDITVDYPERKIEFKTPYNTDNAFAVITRNSNLDLSIFINGRTVDFKLENQADMIDLCYSYLVPTDPRIAHTRQEIERLRSIEDVNDDVLAQAKALIEEFAGFPDLLRERNEYIKIELGDLVTSIENALEEKRQMESSMTMTSEAYNKLSNKLDELIATVEALTIRVGLLEDKVKDYDQKFEELKGHHR